MPILITLFAAAFIAKFHPTPLGIMGGFLLSIAGMDVAAHLCE